MCSPHTVLTEAPVHDFQRPQDCDRKALYCSIMTLSLFPFIDHGIRSSSREAGMTVVLAVFTGEPLAVLRVRLVTQVLVLSCGHFWHNSTPLAVRVCVYVRHTRSVVRLQKPMIRILKLLMCYLPITQRCIDITHEWKYRMTAVKTVQAEGLVVCGIHIRLEWYRGVVDWWVTVDWNFAVS